MASRPEQRWDLLIAPGPLPKWMPDKRVTASPRERADVRRKRSSKQLALRDR